MTAEFCIAAALLVAYAAADALIRYVVMYATEGMTVAGEE
jgi:hypothetical protein